MKNSEKLKHIKSSRLEAVQLLYQNQLANIQIDLPYFEQFLSTSKSSNGQDFIKSDHDYLKYLITGTELRKQDVLQILEKTSQYPLERLEKVLQCILQIAIFELLDNKENISKSEIISSYLDITDAFYDKKEIGIINAILDKVAKSL